MNKISWLLLKMKHQYGNIALVISIILYISGMIVQDVIHSKNIPLSTLEQQPSITIGMFESIICNESTCTKFKTMEACSEIPLLNCTFVGLVVYLYIIGIVSAIVSLSLSFTKYSKYSGLTITISMVCIGISITLSSVVDLFETFLNSDVVSMGTSFILGVVGFIFSVLSVLIKNKTIKLR